MIDIGTWKTCFVLMTEVKGLLYDANIVMDGNFACLALKALEK